METTHTALYRKYRPHTFAEIRGQEPILKALEGAILSGRIPHALLFVGARGTGKTSMARIFAGAAGANSIDIYEIDAASNRGIDDIRGLREAVHTLPYESPRKVYIIDEVHMLTKDAWNAFRNTLEEPPAHLIFILATTESEKLLDTVVSRCQVFQFKAPSRALLRDTVLDIAEKEKFALGSDGADLIALAADGSFRDALGIMQKVMMASIDENASTDEVADIIGAPKGALVMDVVMALHAQDTTKGLAAIALAQAQNVEMKLFARLILERVRALILARHGSDPEGALIHLREDDRADIAALAQDPASSINSALLSRLLLAAEQVGHTYIPQLPLELAIIDLTTKHTA